MASNGAAPASATARDYGRLGQFVLDNGKVEGRQILPEWWLREATQESVPAGVNGASGYGNQWWVGPVPTYRTRGVFGQPIAAV